MEDRSLEAELAALVQGEATPGQAAHATGRIMAGARRAGARAVLSGRWLADTVLDTAGRLPVRSRAVLEQQFGLTGDALADALVGAAARRTAAIGASLGAVATLAEASAAGVVALPAPVLADAVLTALVEMRLIAELHLALNRRLPTDPGDRALAIARAWAQGRGITSDAAATGGSAALFGAAARRRVVGSVRRRLVQRTGRSLTALAPILAGAVAAAELNRRGTKRLARHVLDDLRDR